MLRFPKLAKSLGGGISSTVIHACDRIKEAMTKDFKTNQAIKELTQQIKQ